MLRATLALAALAVLARSAGATPPAPAPPPPPEPNLAAARQALEVAQEYLRLAGTGKGDEYGGHRKLALELVNTAVEQVEAALAVAAEAAARAARQPAPAPAKRKRR